MRLDKDIWRFDSRLVRRNLRQEIITEDELEKHLESLEDVSHLGVYCDDENEEDDNIEEDFNEDDFDEDEDDMDDNEDEDDEEMEDDD